MENEFDDVDPDTNSGTPKAPERNRVPVFVKVFGAVLAVYVLYNIL
jgi:hypothetical protein